MQTNSPFPWRPLAALLLALVAQTLLEPPARGLAALFLYALAAGLALWSSRRGEWMLSAPQSDSPASHPLTPSPYLHILPLFASIPLLGAAFYFFGGNQFTWLNLLLWLAGITFFIRAFWQDSKRSRTQTNRDDTKTSTSVRVFWLIFTTVLLAAAFFRFYHLASVPAEPFSDHAEKILDLYDVTQGQTHIFFPRNTGREAFQFYWSILIAAIFGTGLSFQTLKIGTALLGLFTLPFIYLLGAEVANRRASLLAMLFAGIAYWPNVISRVGLRFPLYPLFVAPTFYFLLRGLRRHNRNDFILSGIFLGVGLHGYSPFRVAPGLVIVTIVLWWLWNRKRVDRNTGKQIVMNTVVLAGMALVVFLPLLRYALEFPDAFWFRTETRLTTNNPLPILVSNIGNGLLMFNVNDGNTFVNSVVHRPALDIVTGALFVVGLVLLLKRRHFLDLWLVAAILTLVLPSVLSLAFPDENPAINRAGGRLSRSSWW